MSGDGPARELQVGSQMQGLAAAIKEAGLKLDVLEKRLEPVLVTIPPGLPGKEEVPVERALVPFADRLRGFQHQVNALTIRIDRLLGRMEL